MVWLHQFLCWMHTDWSTFCLGWGDYSFFQPVICCMIMQLAQLNPELNILDTVIIHNTVIPRLTGDPANEFFG
jgi:hypothetical protein